MCSTVPYGTVLYHTRTFILLFMSRREFYRVVRSATMSIWKICFVLHRRLLAFIFYGFVFDMDGNRDGVKEKGNKNGKVIEAAEPKPKPTVTFVTFRFDEGMMVPVMWDTGPVYCGWCDNHKSASLQALYKHLRANHQDQIGDLRHVNRGKTGKGNEFELGHEKGEWMTLENANLKYVDRSRNGLPVEERNEVRIPSVDGAEVCDGGVDRESCGKKRKVGSDGEVARSGSNLHRNRMLPKKSLLLERDGEQS